MTLETFFAKFEQFADAPNAVAKMRELILKLAVQGKVAAQVADDEPAAALLARLLEYKAANPLFGRNGRGKGGAVEVGANCDGLPANWVKTTVGEVLYVIRGASPRPKGDPQYFSETRTSFHWVKISDIRKHGRNGVLINTDEFLTEAGMRKSVLLPKGTLVLTNSATIGVPIVLGIEGCCIHDGYLAFPNFPHELLSQKFLLYLFYTLRKHAEGNARGLAQLNLNTDLVRSFPFGLPPLAEQKRIVVKVDELMALCDRLEAQQKERETRHAALARASLDRFAEAPTPANLNLLFHRSYSIPPADLRKAILTLAVQGALANRFPEDGDSAAAVNHARRVAGTLDRPLAETEPLLDFDLPPTWAWVALSDIAEMRLGKMLDAQKNHGEPYLYLRNTNVHWFRFELASIKTMLFAPPEIEEYRVVCGDVLICEGGHGIARSAVWGGQIPFVMFQKALHRVRPYNCLDGHFLTFCLRVFEFQGILNRFYTGAGIPHFTGRSLARVSIPVPPIAEQKRIVAKVDQLMALVDQLEAQLGTSAETAERLTEAVVSELTQTA